MLRRRSFPVLLFVLAYLWIAYRQFFGSPTPWKYDHLLHFYLYFGIGMLCRLYQDSIPLTRVYAGACLSVLSSPPPTGWER